MAEFNIIPFDKENPEQVASLKALFKAYYAYFQSLNIALPLVKDGEALWLNGVIPSLNRLSTLSLAEVQGRIVGFAHGSVKLLPDYLGGHKAGVVQHVYVSETHQRQGIAEALINNLHEWFHTKQVHSVELQVIAGNAKADAFWKKMGYTPELQQFRRHLE